ncbi:hypothetical protein Ancab_013911 [Ancistrocladus abbreviatus]
MALDSFLLQQFLSAFTLFFITRFFLRLLVPKSHPPLPPGPKGWPVVGCLPLLGTMPHVSLARLANRYGPIMYLRMGTCDVVVASSPDAAKAFLKTLDHSFTNRPLGAGPNYIAYNASDMVFADFGPRWKLLRKLANLHMLGATSFGDWAPLRHTEGIQGKMKRLHDKFDGLITKMLEDHMKTADQRKGNPDLFDIVMGITEETEGVKLTMTNYKALLLNLFIAGTDTSSSTMEWAMAEMLKNPTILKHAQAEIDSVIGKNRRLEESDLPKLRYLQAICKETFRRHPVVPLSLPRVTSEACQVNGYYIPKNTRLFVNVWAIGQDPELWEGPLEFNPERFLTEKGAKVEPWGNDFELIPFGSGRRICAGIRMGIAVVQYVIGTLVHCFEWKLIDGVELEMEEVFGLVLGKAQRLKAFAIPRLEPNAYMT